MKTMQYRIQIRKYSSNIIEASKDGIKWFPYLAPLVNKIDGDKICNEVFNYLK